MSLKLKGFKELDTICHYIRCKPSESQLLKYADTKFGEYESYIKELEDEIIELRKFKNVVSQNRVINSITKEVIKEIKERELYKKQEETIQSLQQTVNHLYDVRDELLQKLISKKDNQESKCPPSYFFFINYNQVQRF